MWLLDDWLLNHRLLDDWLHDLSRRLYNNYGWCLLRRRNVTLSSYLFAFISFLDQLLDLTSQQFSQYLDIFFHQDAIRMLLYYHIEKKEKRN